MLFNSESFKKVAIRDYCKDPQDIEEPFLSIESIDEIFNVIQGVGAKSDSNVLASGEEQGKGGPKIMGREFCEWERSEDIEWNDWETTCGNRFCIENGTPKENKMEYCCYCGKHLKQVGR